jgi:hypothetical protein
VPTEPADAAPASAPVATSPAGVNEARKALGGVKGVKKAAPAPRAAPRAAVAAPAAEAAVAHAGPGRIPTRDELTAAWADTLLPKLAPKTRAIFAAGRWVDGPADAAAFALPNEVHRGRADKQRADVERVLADHFGDRVPLSLVVDEGQVTQAPAAPVEDENVDPRELSDAPPGLTSPEDRLKQAFPGAEEVVT